MGGSIGKVGSGNAYVYADNAPVMTTDPSGRGDIFLCALGIAGAIVGIGAGLAGLVATVLLAGPSLLARH